MIYQNTKNGNIPDRGKRRKKPKMNMKAEARFENEGFGVKANHKKHNSLTELLP